VEAKTPRSLELRRRVKPPQADCCALLGNQQSAFS
jgi:hypothetical protein